MGRPGTRVLTLLALLAAAVLAVPAGGASAPKPPRKVPGIDVSRFQEIINWKRVAGSGIRFAFVQASRGRGGDCAVVPDHCGVDPYWDRNYERARANGIRVGPYHRAFVHGATVDKAVADARAEADVFIAAVGRLQKGDLRPALDVETPFRGVDARRLRIWIRTWLRRVEVALGPKPIVYTNTSSWAATGNTRVFADNGHRLWVANWGVRRPSVPAQRWGGRGWSVWQFTSTGRVPGVNGDVDRNRLRVPLKQLAAVPRR